MEVAESDAGNPRSRNVALVERDRETTTIDGLIAEAVAGEGRCLVIEGAAGLGKSRLLEEVGKRAERPMRVLAATASEFERDFNFGVVHQLFERTLADEHVRERALAGAAQPAATLFDVEASASGNASGLSFPMLHGLYWMTLNLSEDFPLAILVDDLQHCDEHSLRFLTYLARRTESASLLIAATWRSTDPGLEPTLVAELAQAPTTISMRPAELSTAGIGTVIDHRLGSAPDPAFASACREATGGNPLLLAELMSALQEEGIAPDASKVTSISEVGPEAVARTVFLRLARSPGNSVEVARMVSILGDAPSPAAISALTGLDASQIAEATTQLKQVDILRGGAELSFTHALVRDAVYAEMQPSDRDARHAAAADALREAGATSEQVAAQLLHTPRAGSPWVLETLLEVGRKALVSGASRSAVAHFARALAEPLEPADRARVITELGYAEAMVDGVAAADHLEEARAMTPDPADRAAIAIVAARAMSSGLPDRAGALISDALAELPSDERSSERDELTALSIFTECLGPGDESWRSRLHPYRMEAEHRDAGGLLLAGMAAWEWSESGGTAEETSRLAWDALRGGDLIAADPQVASMANFALVAGEHPEVRASVTAGLAHARRHDSVIAITALESIDGMLSFARGDLEDAYVAMGAARDSYELFVPSDIDRPKAYFYAYQASMKIAMGDVPAARAIFDRGGKPWHASSLGRLYLNCEIELLFAEGRHEDVLAATDEWTTYYPQISLPIFARWRSIRGRSLAAMDRLDEGIEMVRSEVADARHFGAPGTLARSLREAWAIERDPELLEEAVAVASESTAKLEQARALALQGAELRRSGNAVAARDPLRLSLDLAVACGAAGLATNVREELQAAGGRPRRDAASGVESLTASERRVADRAAAGATNKEIAQDLYVTPKTVELHLTNCYRKLGLRSRRELSSALAGSTPPA